MTRLILRHDAHAYMMRSRSALAGVVQCLCLLGKAAVLQGFLPAQSVGPTRSAALLRHASSLPSVGEHASTSGSWSRRRRSGAPQSGRAPSFSMSSSSLGGGGSSGVVGGIAKSWVAVVLCLATIFGPDVLQYGQQGLPPSPRPPLASALSEEQVRGATTGCYGKSVAVSAVWERFFVSLLDLRKRSFCTCVRREGRTRLSAVPISAAVAAVTAAAAAEESRRKQQKNLHCVRRLDGSVVRWMQIM